ncbi:NAD(P)H-dependent oxidoreductase [Shewanella sp. FJAT-52076]|uniref:NAD(P)H-dependent oxidoreductase n=1 Tax=Shewanella sp. FJAT-52076 TaxID=2864202 RepID=UPI001C661CA4|nr:NAD(P)H-dependent oxidoreductase [Shewanella sp. FJAT-52076]QYJ76727.1 NAD(P)H-dependent oxidoreductase [Shewanella sp. FJAT-52076]
MSSVLLLFAHPSQHKSEVCMPMYRVAQSVPGVTCVDLYADYPTFNIDIATEQQRLSAHQRIIWLFPLYWYSTPAILKEWQDLVLEYGFAYGQGGTALHGKSLLCALSAGGSESSYCAEGYNHFGLRQLLSPIEQTASLIGMDYLPPFALFGARSAVEEGRLEPHLKRWQEVLEALVAGEIPDTGCRDGAPKKRETLS